jgi:hypothetical protein
MQTLKLKCFLPSMLLMMFFANESSAQNILAFARVLEATPLDASSKKYYNLGFGFDGGGGFGVTPTTYVVASVGYTAFLGKNSTPVESYIPVKVGIRQYFPGNLLYLEGDGGAGIVTNSVHPKSNANPSAARATADIAAGIDIKQVELNVDFNLFKEVPPDGIATWITLKAGWRFAL